jgi:hypothetical protein
LQVRDELVESQMAMISDAGAMAAGSLFFSPSLSPFHPSELSLLETAKTARKATARDARWAVAVVADRVGHSAVHRVVPADRCEADFEARPEAVREAGDRWGTCFARVA